MTWKVCIVQIFFTCTIPLDTAIEDPFLLAREGKYRRSGAWIKSSQDEWKKSFKIRFWAEDWNNPSARQ